MPRYEYKLVPAPEKALKQKGLKGAATFAATLEDVLNEMGRDGWSYLRADTLPEEVRTGLTSKTTVYRNILIFQRALPQDQPDPAAARATRRRLPPQDEEDDDTAPPALVNLFADPEDPPAGPGPTRKP
ncbi:DUF4177 domain-containing protein [Roseicyclus mahoneyensis]|uniref:Uncharacterized protein DUF4177 n=1 Tax=Roseicyclus mahoneyensis TaxID=164332 RepID=A0A316GMQ8_9RHOB|nr:DUF4177 domain-containing protein [Roseicyclus mahoneyensis]PWK62089.1 uncharacterized protein DUF4177 [Roseicyclus mahoneyensis]